jgi:hypothetical protein
MTESTDSKRIELIFPETKVSDQIKYTERGLNEKIFQSFSTSLDEITNWFERYDIESIELWISGGIETGGILRLAVSAKGEGGLKLTLKPRNKIKDE